MRIYNIILVTLSLNLLFTNTMMMLDSRLHNTIIAVIFAFLALTFSVSSALTIATLRNRAIFAIFALLDGFGMFAEFAPHGINFQTIAAAYFAIYLAVVVYVAPMVGDVLRERKTAKDAELEELEDRFVTQRDRARNAERKVDELRAELELCRKAAQEKAKPAEEPKTEPQPQQTEKSPAQCANNAQTMLLSDEESAELLSIKRSFARCKDENKRRERWSEIKSANVKHLISEIYNIS